MATPTQIAIPGQMAQWGGSLQGSVEADAPHTHQTAARQSQKYPVPGDGQALLRLCPWLTTVPNRLLERLLWTEQSTNSLQGKDILLLYTGPSDGGALDDVITSQQPDLGSRILAVDILRPRTVDPMTYWMKNFTHSCVVPPPGAIYPLLGAAQTAGRGVSCDGFQSRGHPDLSEGVHPPRRGVWRQTPERSNWTQTRTACCCLDKWSLRP